MLGDLQKVEDPGIKRSEETTRVCVCGWVCVCVCACVRACERAHILQSALPESA